MCMKLDRGCKNERLISIFGYRRGDRIPGNLEVASDDLFFSVQRNEENIPPTMGRMNVRLPGLTDREWSKTAGGQAGPSE